MERLAWIVQVGLCHHKGPYRRAAGGSGTEIKPREIGRYYTAGSEDGGGATSLDMQAASGSRKRKETDLFLEPRERTQPHPPILDL